MLHYHANNAAEGSLHEVGMMWHLWRLRPRPLWPPRQWPWQYYAWRVETYTGIPASEVTWQTFLAFLRQPQQRRALWRYIRWLRHMRRLRRWERSGHAGRL
ncbi:MAG: hypothetical protein FJZ47_13685 [Candidatus Tectomicrobia bacterium]|uniref:Uncharacterized protein n=1 Tax=Tectimicrobiota bacterium TaxID=2528274 RepID=A0A937W329_UNCTE|nr:hypothetical protein [Candidatus Tectomicrobia bacterium]